MVQKVKKRDSGTLKLAVPLVQVDSTQVTQRPKYRSLCVKVERGEVGDFLRRSSARHLAESHAEVATGSLVFNQLTVAVGRYSGLS